MKFFKKKGFLSKLIIVLLVIMAFNAIVPTHASYAGDDDYVVGGALLKPIIQLVLKIGDGFIDLAHRVIFGMSTSLIEMDTTDHKGWQILSILGAVVVGLIVAAGIAVALVSGVGWVLGLLGTGVTVGSALTASIGTIVSLSIGTGAVAGMYVHASWYGDVAVMPMYEISPQEIFEGKISILNANFFSPESDIKEDTIEQKKVPVGVEEDIWSQESIDINNFSTYSDMANIINGQLTTNLAKYGLNVQVDIESYDGFLDFAAKDQAEYYFGTWKYNDLEYEARLYRENDKEYDGFVKMYLKLNTYRYEIIKHAAPIASTLKPTISNWYYTMRNFALVLMMVELVYIGIRIMLCSVASEKAKYKNMFFDWVVAVCLIFIMHYIMAFANNIVDQFVKIANTLSGEHQYFAYIDDDDGKIRNALDSALNEDKLKFKMDEENPTVIQWDCGNLMGLARVQAAEQGRNVQGVSYIGYSIAYIALVIFTYVFLFTYLRRVIYLAFLTVVAPMVAFTYPIDKINDGKSQAFDMWLKEYIFNLLIQPFHLILYIVLITSAFELASDNILYTLVAIGFMMPAEKLLRKFFGFEKAQTPGLLGGAAGAALLMSGMNKILHKKPPIPHKDGGDNGGKIKEKDDLGNLFSTEGTDDKTLFNGLENNKDNLNNEPQEKPDDDKIERASDVHSGIPKTASVKQEPPKMTQEQAKIRQQEQARRVAEEAKKKEAEEQARRKTQLEAREFYWPDDSKKEVSRKRQERKKSAIRGVGNLAKSYGKQQFKRLAKGTGRALKNMPKNIAKVAGGAALGAGAGMIGIAAGMVSGDLGKAAQYAGGGAVAGYSLGSNLANSVSGALSVNEQQLVDEFERGYYGSPEEYKKAKLEQRKEEYVKDEKNIEVMQELLGYDRKDAVKILNSVGADCVGAGITNLQDIATVYKMENELGKSRKEAMTIAKTYNKAGGRPSKMGDKETANWNFKARNIAQRAGIEEAYLDEAVTKVTKEVEDFGIMREGLRKAD